MRKHLIVATVIITSFIIFQFSACSSINLSNSTTETYWNDSNGTIETNDVTRLQQNVPFTIILPKYLADGVESYNFVMQYYEIGTIPTLKINYSLASPKEINISEGPPQDGYPRPLPPGLLAKMHPDYTSITLAGIEVLESNGYGTILHNTQNIKVSALYYIWEQNGLHFSTVIKGYEQPEARQIIESMIN